MNEVYPIFRRFNYITIVWVFLIDATLDLNHGIIHYQREETKQSVFTQCKVICMLCDMVHVTVWVTHICISKLTIIGSNNGLPSGRRQAIIWTSDGILLIGPIGTNFGEILIEIYIFSFKEMQLKMPSENGGHLASAHCVHVGCWYLGAHLAPGYNQRAAVGGSVGVRSVQMER